MTEYPIICKLEHGRVSLACYFGEHAYSGFTIRAETARDLAARILAVCDDIDCEKAEKSVRDAQLRALAADEAKA